MTSKTSAPVVFERGIGWTAADLGRTHILLARTSMSDPSLRRLAKDVAEVARDPLDSSGIFYHHNETDIRKGAAIIRGPEGTAYEHGYYYFLFEYPTTYPTDPPKVSFRTSAPCLPVSGQSAAQTAQLPGKRCVRMHPNLYVDGKVCLSLLGTWDGPPWTSCCTIRILLLAIQSILDDDPYMNEPNVRDDDASHIPYNRAVKFHNLYDGLALFRLRTYDTLSPELQARLSTPLAYSVSHVLSKLKREISERGELDSSEVWVGKYSFCTRIDYGLLLAVLSSIDDQTNPKQAI
jgi:ubiquitin-protein ligase